MPEIAQPCPLPTSDKTPPSPLLSWRAKQRCRAPDVDHVEKPAPLAARHERAATAATSGGPPLC